MREIDQLRDSIGVLLIPELEQRGFRSRALTQDEARTEIGCAFPFGRLCRSRPAGVETVEVQFDKHGRPAFRLNMGTVPLTGIQHPIAGFIPTDDVWVTYLDRYYVLSERSVFRRWFSLRRSRTGTASQHDVERLVRGVVNILGEVDALFRDGTCGPHVREVNTT